MIRLPKCVVGVLALALLLGLAMPVVASETSGTIRTVDATKGEVLLKGTVSDTTYSLNKDGFVYVDGKRSKMADLKDGDKVNIRYEKEGNAYRASEIRCLRKGTETTGTINNTVADKQQVVIKGTLSNTVYEMDKNGVVLINGKDSNFSDLRAADQVRVTYRQEGDRRIALAVWASR